MHLNNLNAPVLNVLILSMINLYTNLINTCKAELALCFHLFPEAGRQVIISAFPDHHHKTVTSLEVRGP